MKLNTNSTLAKLYRWYYLEDSMPKSLCTYFWKLVAMWIFIVPYVLITIPYIVVYNRSRMESRLERVLIGLIIWLFIYGIISMIIFVFALFSVKAFDEQSPLHGSIITGGILWLACIAIGILHLLGKGVEKLSRIIRERKQYPVQEPEPSITKEFWKATINKYCPKIDWE